MELKNKNILIVGAGGFVASHLITKLAKFEANLILVSKGTRPRSDILTAADTGKFKYLQLNVLDQRFFDFVTSNQKIFDGIIYLIGSFGKHQNELHNLVPKRLAEIAKINGIPFIHFSALGLNSNLNSKYGQTKALGERNILATNRDAIIIRPGLIVGKRDKFLDYFIKYAVFTRFFATPRSNAKFVIVSVSDLSSAVVKILINNKSFRGKTFELFHHQILTYHQVIFKLYQALYRKCILFRVPVIFFAFFGINSEMRKLIKNDILPIPASLKFGDLNLTANSVDQILSVLASQYITFLVKQQKLLN